MWSDNETATDLIGFQVHADLIRAVATNPKMLPLTIGVFGDWGGGKTSIMRMLERDLDPERWPAGSQERRRCEDLAVVYVNTWIFEGYDDAKAAILTSVLQELREHKRFAPKVRDRAASLMKSVDLMRLGRFAMKYVALPTAAAFLTGGAAAVPAALAASIGLSSLMPQKPEDAGSGAASDGGGGTAGGPEWSEFVRQDSAAGEPLDVRTFRERFGQMLTDGGIKSLVVLVDDLDRCTPDRIIDNLEAIKLFLSVEQTAFVIGADRRIVEHAIRSRYAGPATESSGSEESNRLVKDYLEKLVQVPYTLPRLSASEIHTYMVLLFCQHHLNDVEMAACLGACARSRDRNRYGSFCYGDVVAALKRTDLGTELGSALSLCASVAPLIADGLKGNPRQVKRFLNALLLRKELAHVAGLQDVRNDVLVKLMILEYAHTELFSELFVQQAQEDGYPKKLSQLEAALAGPKGDVSDEDAAKKIDARWATSSVRKWVAMEPLLATVDLRDYFWLARDRLESTFSGIAMVPPAVRAVLENLMSSASPKRRAALSTVMQLSEDERASLLTLLGHRISRQPEEKAGYDALLALVEQDVAGALDKLSSILRGPLEKVPPATGMDIATLLGKRPDLKSFLEPLMSHVEATDTRVGAALKRGKRPKG